MFDSSAKFRECLETADSGTTRYRVFSLHLDSQRQSLNSSHDDLRRFAEASSGILAIVGEWHDSSGKLDLGVMSINRNEFPGESDSRAVERFISQLIVEMAANALFEKAEFASRQPEIQPTTGRS